MSEVETSQLLEEKLSGTIDTLLDLCNSDTTPTICGMISDPEGRAKVKKLVMQRVITGKMDIDDAIISVDKEFDINSVD